MKRVSGLAVYGFSFLMFGGCIQSEVVVVQCVIHIKNLNEIPWMVKKSSERLHKLKETLFMAAAAKSRSSLHIEKCNFNELVLNKKLYLVVFSSINRPLIANYKSEHPTNTLRKSNVMLQLYFGKIHKLISANVDGT